MLLECGNLCQCCADIYVGDVTRDVLKLDCLVGIIWVSSNFYRFFLIHGFESGFELGDVDCFTLRGGVGAAILCFHLQRFHK